MLHRSAATDAPDDRTAAYVDDRLLAEPKSHAQKLGARGMLPSWPPARATPVLIWVAVFFVCYTVSLQEQLFALFTSVDCSPAEVPAGTNATCAIKTLWLAAEADLSITPLGNAGPIMLLGHTPHRYDVSFGTVKAGAALSSRFGRPKRAAVGEGDVEEPVVERDPAER